PTLRCRSSTLCRTRLGVPKTHWLDAACVGASTPERLRGAGARPLAIRATGQHARQLCCMDRFGFPRTEAKATSTVGGLRTGDLAQAVVSPPSSKMGVYVGRLAVRASGSGNITMVQQGVVVQGISVWHCHPLLRSDGYGCDYTFGSSAGMGPHPRTQKQRRVE